MCRAALAFVLPSSAAFAAEPIHLSATDLNFFEKRIRPVLVRHCYECHSEASVKAGKLKGGLRLDFRSALLTGGDSGASIVPGKADESLLIEALKYDSFEMPPSGRLPDTVIADFEKWINAGAADPRTGNTSRPTPGIRWAFQTSPCDGCQLTERVASTRA